MKQEELLREFFDLPPEGQAQVVELIEFLRTRYKSRRQSGNASTLDLSKESFVGMWRDREDMQDSNAWVRDMREREWVKQSG
jgi:uncharacterized protein YfbU (UPF0304 family)